MSTIDYDTGEILDDPYLTIDDMEQQLFESIGGELDQKLVQTRLLVTIADRGLYRQRLDDNGEPFASFSAYLKSIAPKLNEAGIGKIRSIQNWMVKYKIFVIQMGKPESFLREMASHAELLLPAAARHNATSQLLDEDQPTEAGGVRLGKEGFVSLTEEIEDHVQSIKPNVPETYWTVDDTRGRVAEIVGRDDTKAKMEIQARWVGNNVRIQSVSWWVGDGKYGTADSIPIDVFRNIAKGTTVEGLGDEWRK